MQARFVGLKLDHRDPHIRQLNLIWLPTLYIADKRQIVHYRSVNSLPPEDLLDVLDLGEAHARLKEGKAQIADRLLTAALERRVNGPLADELIYWLAIARYNAGGHDDAARDATWQRLKDDYLNSIWTHRIPERKETA
jgi:hypothetical protein